MHLLHITIHDQKEQIVTLRQLEEKHLLKPPFLGKLTLPATKIVVFLQAHPYLSVRMQVIGEGVGEGVSNG